LKGAEEGVARKRAPSHQGEGTQKGPKEAASVEKKAPIPGNVGYKGGGGGSPGPSTKSGSGKEMKHKGDK